MVGTYYGNKIDKLGKMIQPQFPTKVIQIRINVTTHKKTSLEQSSSLHNQIHDIINPKYLKKEREKNLKFPQEWLKDETRHIVQLIHLKGWARHFEHEYIIKLSKKGSCPPSVESNAEFRSQVSLIQTNSGPNCLSRHKQGSQQGFLSTMYPCSTLTEIIFISWYLILSDQKQISI